MMGYGTRRNIHKFVRMYDYGTQSSTTTFFNVEPTLAATDGYTEITALFDKYRILMFDVIFSPRQTEGFAQSGALSVVPSVFCVADPDGTGPTLITDFMQRGVTPILLDRQRTFRCTDPSIADSYFGGGISTAYGPRRNVWLDAAYPSAPHYGLYFLINGAPISGWTCEVFVKLYVEATEAR
jgi:hypothetical protein